MEASRLERSAIAAREEYHNSSSRFPSIRLVGGATPSSPIRVFVHCPSDTRESTVLESTRPSPRGQSSSHNRRPAIQSSVVSYTFILPSLIGVCVSTGSIPTFGGRERRSVADRRLVDRSRAEIRVEATGSASSSRPSIGTGSCLPARIVGGTPRGNRSPHLPPA